MELKYVIPNMEKTFGQLEYAGEGNIEQRQWQTNYSLS